MEIKLKYIFFLAFTLLTFQLNSHAQLVTNNSGLIYSAQGAIVIINGNLNNAFGSQFENTGFLTVSGDITNEANFVSPGNIDLYGNWINNANFNSDTGKVFLKGANQNLGGSNPTSFFNLTLMGNGIKSMLNNINITKSLDLNDIEMSIGNNSLFIENPNINAITRTSGFISNNISGKLLRRTNSTSAYLFPMGSSISITRYRPVEISPDLNILNKFACAFINHDANTDGFFRNQTDSGICQLNDLYYHKISLDSGITTAKISLYYDSLADGKWKTAANWKTTPTPLWSIAGNTQNILGSPLSQINISNWTFSNSNAYILAKPSIHVDLGPNQNACVGNVISLDAGTSYNNYLWSNGATTNGITVNNSGTYKVTVTIDGCIAIDSVFVTFTPVPIANAGPDISICSGASTQLAASGGTNYHWTVNSDLSSDTVNNPNASPTSTTLYIVEVSNGICHDLDSVLVTVLPLPLANAGQDVSICFGSNTQLNANGGNTYNWNTSSGLSNYSINNPTASPTITTSYIVDVSVGACHDQDTVIVSVNPLPVITAGTDTTIYNGNSYLIQAYALTGVTYEWLPSAGLSNAFILNPKATLTETTTFSLTVTDINGCIANDDIIIHVVPYPEIVVYNTFTPNLDGVNDTWVVENISLYPENHLRIYNRNGHIVYEKTEYNNEWDGKYFGSDLPAATYYYVLEISGFKAFKGDVTIIR